MSDDIDPNAGKGDDKPAHDEANVALQEMKARFEKLERQAQGQSATIRKLTETLEAVNDKLTREPAPEEKPKGPLASKLAELEAFKRQTEANNAAAQERLDRSRKTGVRRSIEAQIAGAGVKPSLAKLVAESLLGKVNGSLTFDDAGEEEIAFVKSGDEATPIAEFVANFLASEDGKELLPEKEKPNLSGLMGKGSPSAKGKLRVTQSDLLSGRFRMEDVIAGRVILVDG